jgi:GH15 family glucan-1,4-alpha-glucosidase
LAEWEVPWLPGYNGAKPVRIGNAASQQLQLDVFGEVMDALHQGRCGGLGDNEGGWQLQRALIGHLERIWDQPDQGIWESRAGPRHYTYSKVMAWVAVDRAVRSAREFRMDGPVTHWESLRERIHQDICQNAFDTKLNSFVQSYGSRQLDASLLLLPIVGFLPGSDPRVRGTVAAIERHLMKDGFVQRYDTAESPDGLPAGEGVFLACTFWLADNYMVLGRRDEARELFERLLAIRNDLGLLAEEYTPQSKQFAGNFPQAFSHVALINTAFNLSRTTDPRR